MILTNVYNGEGKISEQEDGIGGVWKLAYSPGKTVVTEPEGGESTTRFDSQDRVTSETDPLGHKTTIAYDLAGNVEEVDQPGGATWHYGYDGSGNLVSIEDPEGGMSFYVYDSHNHLTEYTDPRGKTWQYEWSAANDLEAEIDPEAGETTAAYNAAGEPTAVTNPVGHTTEFGYDGRGNRTTVTDPLGEEWLYGYDARGYLTSKTAPGLKPETLGRDTLGDLLSRSTPEGHETKFEYDANGLPIKITDPAGHSWKVERNAMERPVAYEDPLGGRSELSYDGDLNLTREVDRRGAETAYRYDLADELTEVEGPEGEAWSYGYDGRGNRDSVTDPRSHTTTYAFDLLNRLTSSKEPLEAISEYGYDADGNLASFTDPDGNETTLSYDDQDRPTSIERPLGRETAYGYDPAGNLITKTSVEATLEYGYDAANRLLSVESEESPLRSFAYDPDGRLAEATDEEAKTISLGYTEDGELASIDDGRGEIVSREYDSRGNLIASKDGRGTVSYAYDPLDRIESLTDPQAHVSHFEYGPEGELAGVELPNGVQTTNVYDEAGRLAESTSVKGVATLEARSYGYNAAGQVVSEANRLSEETTYAYDALGRLTEFDPPGPGSTASEYDPAGNRTKAGPTTYSYNALNQLTEDSSGATYSYDGDGRLGEAKHGSEATIYSWDPLDQLRSVATPEAEVAYSYDAFGRRTLRSQGGSSEGTHYGDLGDEPSIDTGSEGKALRSYVQGPAGLLEERAGESTAYPLSDRHGDITALAGEAGEIESREEYDPWGARTSGPNLEFGYLGAQQRRADPASGLVQMGERSYSPETGTFLSEDPIMGHIGKGPSLNHYPYTWDDPLNRYDLNGRDVCVLGACAGEAADGIAEGATDFAESVGHEIEKNLDQDRTVGADVGHAAWGYAAHEFRSRLAEYGQTGGFLAGRASEAWKKITHEVGTFVTHEVGGRLSCLFEGVRHPTRNLDCIHTPTAHGPYEPTEFETEPPHIPGPPSGPTPVPVGP